MTLTGRRMSAYPSDIIQHMHHMPLMHQDTYDIRRDDVRQGRQHGDAVAVLENVIQPSFLLLFHAIRRNDNSSQ